MATLKNLVLWLGILFSGCLAVPAQTTFGSVTTLPKTTTFSPVALSAPTYVQACNNFTGSGSVSSITCTFSSAVAAGDQLYLCINGTTSITPTITGDSGTWTVDPGNGTQVTNIFWDGVVYTSCSYVATAGGGETVLTVTASMGYPTVVAMEIHGGIFDKSDNVLISSGTSLTSNSITPALANSLLIGLGAAGTGSLTAGTNIAWTLPASGYSSGGVVGLEYFTPASATAITAQMTDSSSSAWIMHIVSFKP